MIVPSPWQIAKATGIKLLLNVLSLLMITFLFIVPIFGIDNIPPYITWQKAITNETPGIFKTVYTQRDKEITHTIVEYASGATLKEPQALIWVEQYTGKDGHYTKSLFYAKYSGAWLCMGGKFLDNDDPAQMKLLFDPDSKFGKYFIELFTKHGVPEQQAKDRIPVYPID